MDEQLEGKAFWWYFAKEEARGVSWKDCLSYAHEMTDLYFKRFKRKEP